MAQTNSSDRSRWLLIASVITLGLIGLVQLGCDSNSSGSFVPSSPITPALPAAITAVFPPQNADGALVSTLVMATFSDDMNESTITPTSFTLTLGGAPVAVASVSYDAITRTATLTPAADLVSASEYLATISESVENTVGVTLLTSDFVWRFSVSPAMALVSKDINAVVGNNVSAGSAIDASGRYIVFESEATNLVSVFTTLNRNHIYRKDTVTGEVLLASSNEPGLEADNNSSSPRISDNGRFVVFESTATNLSPIDTGGTNQVFIKDLEDGSINLVSHTGLIVANDAAANPDLSNDGRFVVFETTATNLSLLSTNGASQIYLKDMSNETIDMISRDTSLTAGGTGDSNRPAMSPDARFIVFDSTAGNSIVTLASPTRSVYLFDRMTPDTTELISVDSAEIQGNGESIDARISDDGNFIAFESRANNLIAGDSNGTLSDIFRRDRTAGSTLLVSTADGINSGNDASTGASINGDGTYVAFESAASNLVIEGGLGLADIYVRDFSTLPTVTISRINIPQSGTGEATNNSNNAAISSDGRYVSFDSAFEYDITDDNTITDVYRSLNSTF